MYQRVHFQLISFIFLLVAVLTLCVACNSDSVKYKTTTMEDYTILLPNSWNVSHEPEDTLSSELQFFRGKQQIGGLQIPRYDKEEPINSLFGNHVSRTLYIKDLSDTNIPAKKVLFERNWNEDNESYISYELHVYFIPKDKISKYDNAIAYDFYMDTGKIKESDHAELLNLNDKQAEDQIWKITDLNPNSLNKIVKSFKDQLKIQ